MADFDKNSEKLSLKQLFSDFEGFFTFMSKALILLTIVPTIVAGLAWVKNASYKNQIHELTNKVSKQQDSIDIQNANIEEFSNQILSMQFKTTKYQQETSEIEARYKALSKEKNFIETNVLKDIQQMRKNIYSLNNQIKVIEKHLKPKKKAKEKN